MLNVIALMGRFVGDPELRHTPNGIATCTFRIAVDRSFVRQGEERKADFIDVVVWRQTAEFVCKYFHKGNLVAVNGSLQTRNYEDKSGNKRTAYEVAADNVHFVESKSSSSGSAYAAPGAPLEGARTASEAPASFAAGSADDFSVIDDNEDLPF
ncbi:MAG: single-stranded DNA-binding protein [Ruthenibacterium sp.]